MITCIPSYRIRMDDIKLIPINNPWIINNTNISEGEIHDKVISMIKSLKYLLNGFFQESMSSSSGVNTYQRSWFDKDFELNQYIVCSISPILSKGLYIGFKYEITFNEWTRYGGKTRSGILDNLEEFIKQTLAMNEMIFKATEEDKQLAIEIIKSNFI